MSSCFRNPLFSSAPFCLLSETLRRVLPAALLVVFASCAAAQMRASDCDVEADYLFNFGEFAHVSPAPRALRLSIFDICILGNDPAGETIDKFASKHMINGRRVRIVRILDFMRAGSCDIVCIGVQDNDAIRQNLAILGRPEALTVGDSPEFLKDGGMIQFLMRDKRMRFAVNLNAVRKAHLVIRSQLLGVAAFVAGGPKPEGAS